MKMKKTICQKCNKEVENLSENIFTCQKCKIEGEIKMLTTFKLIFRSIGFATLISLIATLIIPLAKGANSSGKYELPVEIGYSAFSYQGLVLLNIFFIFLMITSFGLFIFFKIKTSLKNIEFQKLSGISLLMITSALGLVISLPLTNCAQTKLSNKPSDVQLFEISDIYRNNMKSSSTDYYFYQSGRIDCQKSKYDFRKKTIGKKVKCFQTSVAKMSELVKLAEGTDFQSAKESYTFFSGGYDWGKSFHISYLSRNAEKTVKLIHSRFGDDGIEPIPPALRMFLQKLGEIDEKMKVKI
jgi:hypothetical protein